MSTESATYVEKLPPASEKGQQIPHDGSFDSADLAALVAKGYAPVDVRFLDGPEAVRLTLRGVRLGTIHFTKALAEALKLEASIYGMLGSKGEPPKTKKTDPDVSAMLDTWGSPDRAKAPLLDLPKTGARGPDKAPRKKRSTALSEIVQSELRKDPGTHSAI